MASEYNSGPIEVFIVTNDEGVVNGYAEIGAVTQLLSPYTRLSSTQLWNTTHATYKIQNNNKSFVHAIVVCKYLSSIPENESQSYKNLRQLVQDLMVGDKKESEEVITELRKELQEIKDKIEEKNNLSDFSGLLNVLKSELVTELKEVIINAATKEETTDVLEPLEIIVHTTEDNNQTIV